MKIEKKVSHWEWEELTMTIPEFEENIHLFRDEDDDYIDSIQATFTKGSYSDCKYMDGKIYRSSFADGIISYENDEYVHYYSRTKTKLGDLLSITTTDRGIIEKLRNKAVKD